MEACGESDGQGRHVIILLRFQVKHEQTYIVEVNVFSIKSWASCQ